MCICGELGKEDGLHGLSCKKTAVTPRRYTLNKEFSYAFSSADIPNILQLAWETAKDWVREVTVNLYYEMWSMWYFDSFIHQWML